MPSSKLGIFILFFLILGCNNRTNGDNCSKTCGKCRHSEQCHHINGKCKNGCNSGYQGDKCDEGKCLVNFYLVRPPHFMFD